MHQRPFGHNVLAPAVVLTALIALTVPGLIGDPNEPAQALRDHGSSIDVDCSEAAEWGAAVAYLAGPGAVIEIEARCGDEVVASTGRVQNVGDFVWASGPSQPGALHCRATFYDATERVAIHVIIGCYDATQADPQLLHPSRIGFTWAGGMHVQPGSEPGVTKFRFS